MRVSRLFVVSFLLHQNVVKIVSVVHSFGIADKTILCIYFNNNSTKFQIRLTPFSESMPFPSFDERDTIDDDADLVKPIEWQQ